MFVYVSVRFISPWVSPLCTAGAGLSGVGKGRMEGHMYITKSLVLQKVRANAKWWYAIHAEAGPHLLALPISDP